MKYLVPLVALLLFSCSEEKEPEIISLEELVGETGSEEPTASADSNSVVTTPSLLNNFAGGQLGQYDTASHARPHSIDRFGFSTSRKMEFTGKNPVPSSAGPVTPVATLYYYTFTDTTKTKNAFYNWLDCFDKECLAVNLGENIEDAGASPMFALIYDTLIVTVEYSCEHKKNNWRAFQDSILVNFGKDYRHRIDVQCNGPLTWK